jgi:hypothetical protein
MKNVNRWLCVGQRSLRRQVGLVLVLGVLLGAMAAGQALQAAPYGPRPGMGPQWDDPTPPDGPEARRGPTRPPRELMADGPHRGYRPEGHQGSYAQRDQREHRGPRPEWAESRPRHNGRPQPGSAGTDPRQLQRIEAKLDQIMRRLDRLEAEWQSRPTRGGDNAAGMHRMGPMGMMAPMGHPLPQAQLPAFRRELHGMMHPFGPPAGPSAASPANRQPGPPGIEPQSPGPDIRPGVAPQGKPEDRPPAARDQGPRGHHGDVSSAGRGQGPDSGTQGRGPRPDGDAMRPHGRGPRAGPNADQAGPPSGPTDGPPVAEGRKGRGPRPQPDQPQADKPHDDGPEAGPAAGQRGAPRGPHGDRSRPPQRPADDERPKD